MTPTIPKPTPQELAARLGLPASSVSQFLKGEVVTHELDASSDKDLGLVVVTVVSAGLDACWEFIQAERVPEIQAATLFTGPIDPANPSLADMPLEEATVGKLLKNPFLSKEEVGRLQKAHKSGKGAEMYKEILAKRVSDYWAHGLAGIVPYQGNGRDPKTDLGHANDAILKLVLHPAIREEIMTVPSKSNNMAEMHSLNWTIQKGNDQEAPVLNHVVKYRVPGQEGFLLLTRRFYAGTDYDSSQIVTGVLPTSDGRSAIFYTNRTYTSSVAGFGGSAKRSIGRKMMKSKLIETMKKAQKVLV